MSKNILIVAGGTGGHIYPAVALAKILQNNGFLISFVMGKRDKCESILEKEGFRYYRLSVSGMPRKLSFSLFAFVFRLLLSTITSFGILKKEKPLLVLGLGNYLSFPVLLSAKILGIPSVIHEQNFLPGIANRVLSRIAEKVMISFPDSIKYFNRNKIVFTGNIVRKEIIESLAKDTVEDFRIDPSKFKVLIFGGSLGAHSINQLMVNSLDLLEKYKSKLQFMHLTGEKDFEFIKNKYKEKGFDAKVMPYLHAIGSAYAFSDLVVCRSGATTVAELIALKKPSILIPFPYATENHQRFNADYIGNNRAAIVIEEKDVNPEKLAGFLSEFIDNPEKIISFKKMFNNITAFQSLNPEKIILETITSLMK
ncbi:MAG: undecaprenyldiphospho-muramoylpentapeptide beta-N-acetylglucosaminyltransferase [Elusimicrobia bacterium RIFOXYA2_FULL_40_6]|nr:MAG: undecaprenyldiphospho-muramoylpentapeptide beta-N-acetylglucosaminyltransferase [Elusimicrobia bacterium RIFOXYA2_FULL_40_6]